MYFKIPYDFMILRSVFTIQVWFAYSVPCQNHDFNNLDQEDSGSNQHQIRLKNFLVNS